MSRRCSVRASVAAPLLAAAVFAAASPLLTAYRVPGTLGWLAVAAAGPVVVTVLAAALLRVGPAGRFGLSAAVVVLALLLAAGSHPSAVARAVGHGPAWLVSETLPLTGGRILLAAPIVLVSTTGSVAAEMEVRRLARPADPPVGLAPVVLLFVVSTVVASAAPVRLSWSGPALLVLATAYAALSRVPGGQISATLRPAATGLAAICVVAAVLAAVAGPVGLRGPGGTVHRSPPAVAVPIVDPVDVMGARREAAGPAAGAPLLEVTLEEPFDGYLASAVLAGYDGNAWQFSSDFLPTGGRVPAPPGSVPGTDGVPVTAKVDITGHLPIPMLPAPDRPVLVEGAAVAADATTGMLLAEQAGRITYEVKSRAPLVTLDDLPPGSGNPIATESPGAEAADLELPPATSSDLATAARFTASLTGMAPAPTVSFLQAVLHALQTHESRFVAPAPSRPEAGQGTDVPASGTALSEVLEAVTVDRVATPEQFATFFALVARYLGVPARVVTGFRLTAAPAAGPVPAGHYAVTARQAWTWAEIPLAGLGWTVADPTPATTSSVVSPPQSVRAPTTTLPSRPTTLASGSPAGAVHALAAPVTRRKAPARPGGRLAPALFAAGIAVAALAGVPAQAAARRKVRRARRNRGGSRSRAVGAWWELLDGIGRYGLAPRPGATASEVAREVGDSFGADVTSLVTAVGVVADRALYCTSQPVPEEAVEKAWSAQRQVTRAVARGADRRQRLSAAVRVGGPAVPRW